MLNFINRCNVNFGLLRRWFEFSGKKSTQIGTKDDVLPSRVPRDDDGHNVLR